MIKKTIDIKNLIISTIIAVLLIINSGYALYTIKNYAIYVNFILCLFCIIPIIKYYKKNKIDKFLLMAIALIFMVIITYVVSGFTATNSYIYYITSIFIGLGISIKYDFKDIANIFVNVMTAVSIISLIGYFFVNYTNILSSLPIINNSNGIAYGIGYIFNYITIIPERNCGIFWEPGVFATFLIIAILFETCFKEKKSSVIKIFLFIICIITTKSTAGYRIISYSIYNDSFKSSKEEYNY